jgi:two-component system, LytTR family, response regulator
MQLSTSAQKIPLVTAKGVYFFAPEEIIRLEAKSNYTHFYFRNHKPILTARVLKKYVPQLEPLGFIRTHRSHLVNRQHILYTDTQGNVVMEDTSKAEISRRLRKSVMYALKN